MADSLTSISGLSSGIQWQDLIEQIIRLEQARQVTPITNEISAVEARTAAWSAYGTLVNKLNDAAKTLRDGTALGALKLAVANSPTTSRSLVGATLGSGAVPGSYRVEVQQLASAQKLAGAVVDSPSAALGVSGEFRINGRAVHVETTDSINSIRDKINALNSGTGATRVSASVLTVAGQSRLVLISDVTGAQGIELDQPGSTGDAGLLGALGFASDAPPTLNVGSDGSVQSARFSSVSSTILAALGVSVTPPPGSIKVNGKTVTITADMSLSQVVALVNASSPGAARIEQVTTGGATAYRMHVTGTVEAAVDPMDPDVEAASQQWLEALGFTRRSFADAAQSVSTGVLQEGGAPATGATTLAALGVSANDTFTIAGTTGDGKVVRSTFTVGDPATQTLQSLAEHVQSAYGAAGRDVSVSIEDGRLVVRDSQSGDSQLTFSIAAGLANGTLDFGATTTVVGRTTELAQGRDAQFVVDGKAITRASNVVTDAIGGVTLTLQQAEVGTTVTVDVSRDVDQGIAAVQSFAKAYNELLAFVEKESASTGRLAYNSSLRSSLATFRSILLSDVAGLPDSAAYKRASPIGVALSKTGTLEVDANALRTALQTDLASVQAVFGSRGTSPNGQLEMFVAGASTQPGEYEVRVTRAATTASVLATTGTLGAGYVSASGDDRMSITDGVSGKTGSIALTDGDDATAVASKLNALFLSERMRLTATVEGGQLRISQLDYGSAPSISVAYIDGGDGSEAAAQVGIAAGLVQNGLDVEGSITRAGEATPVAATGKGQLLVAAEGTPMAGLQLRYFGSDAAAEPMTFYYSLGLGGALSRAAELLTGADGFLASQASQAQLQIQRLTKRGEDAESRIETRRAMLLQQFAAMEAALSKITAQGNWLASQIKALQTTKD